MRKLAALRRHLLAAPLKLEADRLIVLAKEGRVEGGAQSWDWVYKAELIVEDHTGDPGPLMFALLQWLDQHQPDRATDPTFEADLIDHEKTDIAITVELREMVQVQRLEEGVVLHYCDEPSVEDMPLTTVSWQLFINDQPFDDWLPDEPSSTTFS